MALRSGHGTGAGVPRIEVLPVDELPEGVPGDTRSESPADRAKRGQFAPGNSLARKGGRAKAGRMRLADRLGLRNLPEGSAFATYKASGASFRRAQCAALAASVGGGYCGPAPSSFVASAALQLAWSRYLSDQAAQTGDPELAMTSSRLADASRQNLLAAHELCAREGKARQERSSDPHAGLASALAEETAPPRAYAPRAELGATQTPTSPPDPSMELQGGGNAKTDNAARNGTEAR